jgi:CRP/FNR family transcriptional regulator, cyclic AMP receptor protein
MAKRNTYTEHLARVPIFSACTKRELELIARRGTDIVFDAGAQVVREGSQGYEFFVIVDGKASVSRAGRQVATLGPGDFFGELSLLDRTPRNATVTADTRLETVVVSSQEFRSLLEEAPGLTYKLLAGMARRLRDLDSRAQPV